MREERLLKTDMEVISFIAGGELIKDLILLAQLDIERLDVLKRPFL